MKLPCSFQQHNNTRPEHHTENHTKKKGHDYIKQLDKHGGCVIKKEQGYGLNFANEKKSDTAFYLFARGKFSSLVEVIGQGTHRGRR